MESKLKISIVTVCYNSGRTIRDTIESVISQNYSNIEYIVVDGSSTDNTLKIIGEYEGSISKIISEPDEGLYDAMNKGIQSSTGDVVGILNSDDFFESSEVISDVVAHFIDNPSVSLLFGDVVHVDPDITQKITRFYSSKRFKPFKLRFGWMPPHTATFIRKEVFEVVGEYSLDYKISADYELFVRMLIVHKLIYSRLDKVLVRMRSGGLSTSGLKSKLVLNSEIVRACRANGVYTNLLFLAPKIPLKMLELVRRPSRIRK